VSLSMRAKDVEPDRFTAAKNAAKAFVRDLPPRLRVGVVSFAGPASLVQAPTRSSEDLVAAIDRFQLQRATATGSAIIVSLATLFPDQIPDLGEALFGPGGRHGASGPHAATGPHASTGPHAAEKSRKAPARPFEPVPAGSDTSVAIVLLSDGRRTTGPDPLDAAQLAAERGVRVFTVGFGTEQGAEVDLGGWSAYMKLDEEALKAVAELTHGEYFFAGSEAALRNIYQGLSSKLVLERKQTEISSFFAAAAAVLALLSAGLSVAWYGRIA
jgi:Ca-activated chloride channel family protein